MKRTTALAACVALATGSFALTPAAHAAPRQPGIVRAGAVQPTAAGELTASFTLAQTPSQKALTHALAGKRSHGVSSAFAATQPASAHRDAVVAWAQASGLRVVHSSRFLVTVAGLASDLATALGTSLKQVRGYTVPVSAPAVPAALRSHAESVVGVDNRPVWRPHVAYGPADVRAMSHTADTSSAAGAGVTIGTANFSGWVPSDLQAFAAHPMGPYGDAPALPLAAGQIQEISTDGTDPRVPDGVGGDGEVALDAEALLAGAPAANQRMYFGANTDAGSLAVWDQMVQDAVDHKLQVVSTSWGMCESGFDAFPADLAAETSRIDSLVAAGVTVFAASGDSGSYDCSSWDPSTPQDNSLVNNTLAVDFPASHPRVVGVGGTSSQPGATPLTYTHQGWGPGVHPNPDASTFQGFGSGGGYSTHFQTGPSGQPASSTPGRQVPDIAALADPDTPFVAYNGGYLLAGGTSLASPLAAAGLAGVLGKTSPIVGLGNVLPTLYANPSVTHDVVGGGNGYYPAGSGYDHVTGLGVMDWTAFAALVTVPDPGFSAPAAVRSTTVPITITANASSFSSWGVSEGTVTSCAGNNLSSQPASVTIGGTEGGHTITLTALDTKGVCHHVTRGVTLDTVAPVIGGFQATYNGTSRPSYSIDWAMTDAAPSSGLYKTHLVLRDNTLGKVVYQWDGGGSASNHITLYGVPAHAYTVTNVGYDRAGNISATQVKAFHMPTDDTSFSFSGFTRQNNGADFMGSHAVASKAGAYAKVVFTGKTAWVGVIKSRSCGYMDVYIDGVRTGRVNLYSASTKFRQPLRVASFSAAGKHTIVLKAVGTHQSGASGSNIYADSLTVA